jgi:hypothetical protein
MNTTTPNAGWEVLAFFLVVVVLLIMVFGAWQVREAWRLIKWRKARQSFNEGVDTARHATKETVFNCPPLRP